MRADIEVIYLKWLAGYGVTGIENASRGLAAPINESESEMFYTRPSGCTWIVGTSSA